MRLIHLPLDSRPIHTSQARLLFSKNETLIQPPPEKLGTLHTPADHTALSQTLNLEADALVISVDAWLFGGLVQARTSTLKPQQLSIGLSELFSILRPHQEKPGVLNLVLPRIAVTVTDQKSFEEWELETYSSQAVPDEKWEQGNASKLFLVKELVNWCLENTTWHLAIYQEDCSPGRAQESLRDPVRQALLPLEERGYFSLGADEQFYESLGVLAGPLNRTRPWELALIPYPIDALAITPPFEDRPLAETIKNKLRFLKLKQNPTAELSCLILASHAQLDVMAGISEWPDLPSLDSTQIKEVWVADLMAANGGHPGLLPHLSKFNTEKKLNSFSAWNTASNALGICLGAGIWLAGADETVKQKWLTWRILEDLAYQSILRPIVVDWAQSQEFFIWNLEENAPACRKKVQEALDLWCKSQGLTSPKVTLPWNRLFDLGFV